MEAKQTYRHFNAGHTLDRLSSYAYKFTIEALILAGTAGLFYSQAPTTHIFRNSHPEEPAERTSSKETRQKTPLEELIDDKLLIIEATKYSLTPESAPKTILRRTRIYDDYIREASSHFNMPEQLIRAILYTESTGRRNAKSPKGALGPAQIMPATARDFGLRKKDLTDPESAARGCAGIYKTLLREFKDPMLALIAYNFGRGNVRRKLDSFRCRGLPPTWEKFKEEIPEETEGSVVKVLGRYAALSRGH